MGKSEKNNSINYLKAIACLLVIFIHMPFPGLLGNLIIALGRTAVVFFFMISGYYSYNEDPDTEQKKLKKKIKHIAKMAALSIVFYLMWGIFVRLVGSGWQSVVDWIRYSIIGRIPELVLLNQDIFAGHLWFIFALLYAYIVFFFVSKYRLHKLAAVISCVLIVANILTVYITGALDSPVNPIYVRNAWMYGIPCFIIANRLRLYINGHKPRLKASSFVLLMAFSTALIVLERQIFGDVPQLYFGNLLLALSAFVFALCYPNVLSQNQICFVGEHLSMYIYIIHYAGINLLTKAKEVLGVGECFYEWSAPIVLFAVSLAVSYAVYKLNCLIRRKNEN